MNFEELFLRIKDFSKETHGSSNFDQEELFVLGENRDEFAPLKFLCKKIEGLDAINCLLREGFVFDSYDLFDVDSFPKWFENQFGKKFTRKIAKSISIIHFPNNKEIFSAIEAVDKAYEVLRAEKILLNGKKLPVQVGEWYSKIIFGLKQMKSTSQRGFDFLIEDGQRVEVKVHWADQSSPKGVKVRKTLIELSDYCIIMYVARNLMIREVCFLDSDFILRKFSGKGHTIFLKDSDISNYFFSSSSKHLDKLVNKSALMRYASPTFAMKLDETFNAGQN